MNEQVASNKLEEFLKKARKVVEIWGDEDFRIDRRTKDWVHGRAFRSKNSLTVRVTTMRVTESKPTAEESVHVKYGRATVYDSTKNKYVENPGAEYALQQAYESALREESKRREKGK